MKLYIGNKNYSSWSLRGWLVTKLSGEAFEEVPVQLTGHTPNPANLFYLRIWNFLKRVCVLL